VTRATLGALTLVIASTAFAQQERTMEGVSRVALQGGYKWAPNGSFVNQAATDGHPLKGSMPGGPQFSASFGYAPLEWLEATIDVFIGFEGFTLDGLERFTSTTYGALLGVRVGRMDFPVRGLLPYLGFQLGPALSFLTSKSIASAEKLNTGYSINAGLTYRFADKWGFGLDARYLFADGAMLLPDGNTLTLNAGGLWISATVTFFIGAGPKDPMGGML
jgi:opacity protein-like surface antigen